MKKILLSLVLMIAVFATNAQTKVSKTTIVGKWSLAALDVDGMMFYDIDKDSLALGSAIMTQLAAAGQDSAGAVDMMKGQLGAVKELGFEFLADGTFKANGGPQGSEGGTYAIDEATEQMRKSRRLITSETDNFVIDKSDKFADMFIGFLAGISGAAGAIGMITLIGAAIGLMNIMLVAVNERTREVGLIKALGGKKKDVRRQFLFESILISILGAVFGIILGVLVGNIFSLVLHTGFVVPWMWVVIGIVICSVVGLAAGIYPAMKASALNPIDALRYE